VSARHQVKRPDRSFEEFASRKSDQAEETGFLRSVRIAWSAVSPAARPSVKSGPDVFADALVPGTLPFPERLVPTLAVERIGPFDRFEIGEACRCIPATFA
jgi:hypothetical protein